MLLRAYPKVDNWQLRGQGLPISGGPTNERVSLRSSQASPALAINIQSQDLPFNFLREFDVAYGLQTLCKLGAERSARGSSSRSHRFKIALQLRPIASGIPRERQADRYSDKYRND